MPPIDDEAWDELVPAITQQAKITASRLNMTASTRDVFVSDAVDWIRSKGHLFDATKGSLTAWCARVLANRGVDLIRRHAVEAESLQRYAAEASAEHDRRLRRGDDEIDGLPEIDVVSALEEHVRADNRVYLAIDFGLLGEIDPLRADGWIAAAGLPPDFPWRAIAGIEKKAERRKALAAALGENDGWLRQRINRALKTLEEALGGRT